jgi:signal transduction histidine kinase/ActR/RegA family two-component response regulator
MLNRSSERLFYALLGFAVILFLLLVVSLNQWVSQPLKSLSKCLREHNVECLKPLERVQDEFNEVARLIRAFFEQRATLIREMSERVQTQAALQESEERLRHSQKMEAVGRLAGGVAHDFNNLLTAIIGYAELIAERSGDGTTREEARLIGKAGEQAAGLTRQLLAFSRKQILQPRVIDLNALVRDMQRLLRRIIGEHIDLRVETNASESRVLADPTQLEQVILNLGVNARDAMPRGGVLTMRTVNALVTTGSDRDGTQLPPGRYVALIVQDTGCGMDIETKERVFEPFFTTKGPGKGTGLGLATVYGIVRQSGGTILVDSKPGEGTTFTIQLPQAEAPVEDLQLTIAGEARSRDSETVLVVEDEDIVRELVCTVLSEQGYQVLCAANGAEGLRLADEHPGKIDLLVTDVIMPGMSGPEVAAQLRESRPETRVLFVSGYSDGDITDQGVLAPQLRFLEKPFTPDALGMKVREVLDEAAVAPV